MSADNAIAIREMKDGNYIVGMIHNPFDYQNMDENELDEKFKGHLQERGDFQKVSTKEEAKELAKQKHKETYIVEYGTLHLNRN